MRKAVHQSARLSCEKVSHRLTVGQSIVSYIVTCLVDENNRNRNSCRDFVLRAGVLLNADRPRNITYQQA